MTPRTVRRLGRVKKLARAAMWIAMWAGVALVSVSRGWTFVASGCTLAFAALSATAAVLELPPERRGRGGRRKGSGVSGRGRGDEDGSAGEPVRRWRTLAAVSRLMPAAVGRRWLAEAESVLAEVTAARRGAAVRSYLRSAPRLAVTMWAREALRRARLGPRRPG